jgi:bis(5'-nucleosyl)-tetraphosphatase (symmetrical)
VATWVVGDIQGCFDTLMHLLVRVGFSAARDRVWLVGDLVNRGPRSVDVLRWARALGDRATVVLGNHDLHLIARALGVAGPKRRDTVEDVLRAHDRDELIDWLRARPLVHVEELSGRRVAMVHAGLFPSWTVDDAVREARALEAALGGSREDATALLRERNTPRSESLQAFVRLRMLDASGRIADYDGAPADAPAGLVPWFAAPGRRSRDTTIVFGHWSTLGLHRGDGVVGLDTGCVWGRALTALRLDDGTVVSERAVEPAAPIAAEG